MSSSSVGTIQADIRDVSALIRPAVLCARHPAPGPANGIPETAARAAASFSLMPPVKMRASMPSGPRRETYFAHDPIVEQCDRPAAAGSDDARNVRMSDDMPDTPSRPDWR